MTTGIHAHMIDTYTLTHLHTKRTSASLVTHTRAASSHASQTHTNNIISGKTADFHAHAQFISRCFVCVNYFGTLRNLAHAQSSSSSRRVCCARMLQDLRAHAHTHIRRANCAANISNVLCALCCCVISLVANR